MKRDYGCTGPGWKPRCDRPSGNMEMMMIKKAELIKKVEDLEGDLAGADAHIEEIEKLNVVLHNELADANKAIDSLTAMLQWQETPTLYGRPLESRNDKAAHAAKAYLGSVKSRRRQYIIGAALAAREAGRLLLSATVGREVSQ